MKSFKKYVAEFIGTALLTLIGCGVAVVTNAAIGVTALAFGLVIVALAYSLGNVSGCHINPAVSIAKFIRKDLSLKDLAGYIVSQFLGGIVGALILALLLRCDFTALGGNEIQNLLAPSASKLDAWSYVLAFACETILTFVFVLAVLGATDKRFYDGKLGGIIIGLALTLVHLLGISFTGTSVNPARSFGPALLQAFASNTTSLSQVWIWTLAPILGAILAALIYGFLTRGAKKNK